MDNLDWMEASPMYVLTINDNAFGAVAVLDNAIMNDIAQEIGGDFYVIPSSVSEVIIVPMNKEMTSCQLDEMIQEVNVTQVDEQDRLSDHAYVYDAESQELLTAQHYEERNAEHDIVSEITSIKDKLSEKTAEVAMREATRETPVKVKDTQVLVSMLDYYTKRCVTC